MDEQPRFISQPVPLDQLIAMMQTPKQVHVIMSSGGSYTATCNDCRVTLQAALKEDPLPLVWWRCPSCGRITFSPIDNLKRDAKIAEAMGGTFEYEIYFIKDLPPQLPPPENWTG